MTLFSDFDFSLIIHLRKTEIQLFSKYIRNRKEKDAGISYLLYFDCDGLDDNC